MPWSADHLWNLIPLIILALLFFGPKKLPEIGGAVGKTITEFKKSMRETKEPEATPAVTTTQAPAQLNAPIAPSVQATPTEVPSTEAVKSAQE